MRTMKLTAAVVLGFGSLAMAVNFPSGGGIYYANVASQSNEVGGFVPTASASFVGGASAGAPGVLLFDGMKGSWTVSGLQADGATATAVIDMGKVWSISSINTKYGDFANRTGLQYELAVSTDNSTWTTVVGPTAIGSADRQENTDNSFGVQYARYISWKIIGSSGAGSNSLGLTELMAYVPTGAATVPQLEDGYNIVRGKTASALIVNTFNGPGWFNPSGLFDGAWNNDGGLLPDATDNQTAVIDLGASYKLTRLTTQFYGSWPDGQLAISNDLGGPWTVIKGPGTLGDSTYVLGTQLARYVRIISDQGDGSKMQEIAVYTAIPEPATLSLLALAGMGMLARRRR